MKNKIILLAACLIMICSVAHAEERDIAMETLTGLGIIDTENPDKNVTRGEFARIIRKMCRLEKNETDWQKEFLGNKDEEMSLKTETDEESSLFDDVSVTDEYYGDINAVVMHGIMNGVSERDFYPEREVTFEEVAKTLIKISGYTPEAQMNGGYPGGFVAVADDLGINDSIGKTIGNKVSKSDIARMIYNTLDVEVMKMNINGEGVGFDSDDDTVLTYVLDLKKETGIMSQNMISDLYSSVKNSEVIVNGVSIDVSEDKKYVNELLAHKVIVYYNEDGLVFVTKTKDDKSLVVDGKDIESYNDGVLEYNDNKSKKLIIESGVPVIYNGLAVSTITEDMFDIQGGSVEIIKNNSDCDAVVIKKYDTFFVSGVDLENGIVYNKTASGINDEKIEINDEESVVSIKGLQGYTDVSGIKEGCVLSVAKNNYAIDIIISKDSISGTVTKKDNEYTYINDKPYEISKQYVGSRLYVPVTLGSTVKAYLDIFGNIAWVDAETKENLGGYLVKCFNDGEKNMVKIFTLTGKTETYELQEKIAIKTDEDERLKVGYENQLSMLKSGYINYSLDKDMKVSQIIYPLKIASSENRLYEMVNENTNNIRYKDTFKCFSGKVYIGSNTKVIKISQTDGELKLSLAEKNIFKASTDYNISAYAVDPDTMYADVIIYRTDASAGIYERDYVGVVREMSDYFNAEDEVVRKATVYQDGKEIELMSPINNDISAFERATDVFGSREYKIKKGDIIRWSVDADGYASEIQLVYSPYLKNPSGGADGYLAGVTNDKYMIASEFVDRAANINNIYNITSGTQTRTDSNPYSVNGGTVGSMAFRFHQSGVRTMLGWVYNKTDEFITLTTQDLSFGEEYSKTGIPKVAYNEGNMTGVYVIDTIKDQKFSTTYVKYSGGKILEVRAGIIKDVKSYKEYGSQCSSVLCMLRSGEPHQLVIIEKEP